MKLSDIDKNCKKLNIPYAYGAFKTLINPPHLVGTIIDTDNFSADNVVYKKFPNFRLELTTLKKDIKLQKKVEEELLKEIFWNKTENIISDEGAVMK